MRNMLKFPSLERGEARAQTHFCLTPKPMSFLLPICLLLQFLPPSEGKCFIRNRNYKSSLCFYIASLYRGMQYLCLYIDKNKRERNKTINFRETDLHSMKKRLAWTPSQSFAEFKKAPIT